MMEKQAMQRFVSLAAMAATITGLGSCVAQEQYDNVRTTAKHYERQLIDLEARNAELQNENLRLKGQLEASDVAVAEAGFTEEIDQRLANLRDMLADLGQEPGDVRKFRVDGGYVYQMKDSILFGLGEAQVSSDGQSILREVAADIASRPYARVYVRGHTDNVPIRRPETLQRFPHGNLQLSAARAVEVAAFLRREGRVGADRLVVMGFGTSEPVAPNDSAENRQKNRRVELFVADEAGAEGR